MSGDQAKESQMIKLLHSARPRFLISGIALFVFGASWLILLGWHFSLLRILFGYLVLMPAHLSISYSNDYFDVEVNNYDKPALFLGVLLIASWSRLNRFAQETFRKTIDYPSCQWDHDHSCGFLDPGGWIYGFSSLPSHVINE
jgi:hypothetical protein